MKNVKRTVRKIKVIVFANDNEIQQTTYTSDLGVRVVEYKRYVAVSTKVVVLPNNHRPGGYLNDNEITKTKKFNPPHDYRNPPKNKLDVRVRGQKQSMV